MLNFAKTDVGKVRKMNQDYYYISEDETLYNSTWAEIRKTYKLNIKDTYLKNAYNDTIK